MSKDTAITITELPPERAAVLVPLNLQVQALHAAQEPDRYVKDPDPDKVAAFLMQWLQSPATTALIAGSIKAPVGYLIYEIENRTASVLRKAERRAMLHHICVDAPSRNTGIARKLIETMRQRDDVRQADTIWTSYADFNTASASLMRAMDFVPKTVFAEINEH
ncbi:MAG: GNAT family N-acetyltransferase [Aliishimia sp.]